MSKKSKSWNELRKKIVRKIKWTMFYLNYILQFYSTIPAPPGRAMGVPPAASSIMGSLNSSATRAATIAKAIKAQEMPNRINFTTMEMEKLYDLSIQCKDNSINREELITTIKTLRSGEFVDVVVALSIIASIIIIISTSANGFTPINPPHLQWLYGDNSKRNDFGLGKNQQGPSSVRVRKVEGTTQNAGSDQRGYGCHCYT